MWFGALVNPDEPPLHSSSSPARRGVTRLAVPPDEPPARLPLQLNALRPIEALRPPDAPPERPLQYLRLPRGSPGTNLWQLRSSAGGLIRGDDDPLLLWIGRWTEKPTVRIVTFGTLWQGMQNRQLVADPAAPAWEEITVSSGAVPIRLWNLSADVEPSPDWPAGTLLLELIAERTLRLQWFEPHGPVPGFTAMAKCF